MNIQESNWRIHRCNDDETFFIWCTTWRVFMHKW